MTRYKVVINTYAYKCEACSQKNWELGTRNDHMLALNGWHTTENNIREVLWRVEMFRGQEYLDSEWDESKGAWSDRYIKWKNKRCNTITYLDRLCCFERKHRPSGYGFMQGYFDIDKVIAELKQKDVVRIPFEWLYDVRQYYKGMDGCYMEITKI